MKTILAVAAPTPAGGSIGLIALVLLLLAMIVGLVLVVRALMVRLHRQVSASKGEPLAGGEESSGEESKREATIPSREGARPVTGRELKARYLRGEISRAEFDERLRRLQIDEYLGGKE